jgi:glycosyltransferase involved in cell wall biosynthesis
MIITYVYADQPHEWNTSNWRCVMPARAINRSGRHSAILLSIVDFEHNTADAQNMCGKSDVIVVERNLRGDTLLAMMRWKARGKVIIANFDDAYQVMNPSNISYPYWAEGRVTVKDQNGVERVISMSPKPLTQFKWGLRLSHGITTPSKTLAQDWADYSISCYLPNYFEVSHYLSAGAPHNERILIGWGGSMSHFQSFTDSGVLGALQKVCAARPNVSLLICGDKRVFDQVKISPEQKEFQPYLPYDQWPNAIARYDIGLAPLQGEYDKRRSWIKPMEYMLLKIPWVASEGPAYEDLASYGRLVKNTPDAWEQALIDMVDNLEEKRKQSAGAPYQFAMSQDINLRVDEMLKIYAKIALEGAGIKLIV